MALEITGPGTGSARLALRGATGRLWSDLHRPGGAPGPPLLVFFPDAARPVVDPAALCRVAGVAVLVTRPVTVADAVTAVEWIADHAAELDADSARLLVGGERGGAALAAAAARHARDEGWPPLLGQLLVHPGPGAAPAPDTAPPTVVATAGADPTHRIGAALRRLADHPQVRRAAPGRRTAQD